MTRTPPSRFLLPAACAAALVVGAATASASDVAQAAQAASAWDQLVKAAQAEGRVEVILSGQMPQKLRKAMPEFQKKYGITINFQTGSGRQHAERILAERRVGRFTIDAWIGGSSTGNVTLVPNGALTRIDELLLAPEVTDKSRWFRNSHYYADRQGRYIFTWGASPLYTIAYNTNLVDPSEIKSFADILNPKWKGKIVSWSPADHGTGPTSTAMYLNPKIGEQWFRRWATEMGVTIVKDARQGAEWVAVGRFPIGMFGLNTQSDALARQGFPIKSVLPHPLAEGEVLSSSAANIMAFDRAPNPNAMKLFVNWALSREAQALFLKVGETTDTLRTDVPNDVIDEQFRIKPGADYFVPFADPRWINEQGEILKVLRGIMEEAGYR